MLKFSYCYTLLLFFCLCLHIFLQGSTAHYIVMLSVVLILVFHGIVFAALCFNIISDVFLRNVSMLIDQQTCLFTLCLIPSFHDLHGLPFFHLFVGIKINSFKSLCFSHHSSPLLYHVTKPVSPFISVHVCTVFLAFIILLVSYLEFSAA